MTAKSWFLFVGFAALVVAGCNKDVATPEDDAFQKQLAAAAAKNKGAPPKSRMTMGKPAPGQIPAPKAAPGENSKDTGDKPK